MPQNNKMSFRHIRIIVVLGAIAIISIVLAQFYFMRSEWKSNERQFSQTVSICLKDVAYKIYSLNNTMPTSANPVRQLSSNYFVVDLNSTIDANILEHYLKTEFLRYSIQTDFEYAIYNCETDKMEYGNYFFNDGKLNADAPSTNLPTYSEYSYYFGVNFPKLRNTISGDMSFWFVIDGVLLLAIIFFVYAILIILNQKRLSELQRDFINTMTHEFKTPIASIQIAADVISNPESLKEPARINTYGSIIKQEVDRLNSQVDRVLQIARAEKKSLKLHFDKINLNEIIETAVQNCKANNEEKVRLETILDQNRATIMADKTHVSNILYNLLDNAVKYGGDNVLIRVTTKKISGKILLEFYDDGPGIERIFHKHIFKKFYRVPTHNIHNVKGFGLGLFYVKSVCDAHRWNIELDSDKDKGTRFTITIPEA
jgi:two-component system, OmpR family, phosphate regulon sensor histidine kinase PhoR